MNRKYQQKKPRPPENASPPERILNVARDLFYRQGYRATGINEVIGKSDVAKATFYNHFPSKDDLGLAYLKSVRRSELDYLAQAVAGAKGPQARLLAVIESLGPWLEETQFRGCAFMNMASEIPDPASPLREEGRRLYSEIRRKVKQLTLELVASDEQRYGHLDAGEFTNDFMIIFAGAVAMAEIYHDQWPVEHAIAAARRLLTG